MNEEARLHLQAALGKLAEAICEMDAGVDLEIAKRVFDQLDSLAYPDNDEEEGE